MRSDCRRCVAMDVRFDLYNQAFRRHATIFSPTLMRFICQHTLYAQHFTPQEPQEPQEPENDSVLCHRADTVGNGYKGAIHNTYKVLKSVMIITNFLGIIYRHVFI
jgi:hypothetical protein